MRILGTLLLAVYCMVASSPSFAHAKKSHHKAPIHTGDKITDLVLLSQPLRGLGYARRVSKEIKIESRREHIPPNVVATTAYIESEFNPNSGPCTGIMQLNERAHRKDYRGKNPSNLNENICLGARELHQDLASRGGNYQRMWGRYNGAGSHSSYVIRAMRVYKRLQNGNYTEWKHHLEKKGELWR